MQGVRAVDRLILLLDYATCGEQMSLPKPINTIIFFHDADEGYLEILERHLEPLRVAGIITVWHRKKSLAGTDTQKASEERLREAQLILLLISADFISQYQRNLARLLRDLPPDCVPRVVPIILRPCAFEATPLSGRQPIPHDGLPLAPGGQPDEVRFLLAATEIRRLCSHLRSLEPMGVSAITSEYAAVVQTLAQLERERYLLENHPAGPPPDHADSGTASLRPSNLSVAHDILIVTSTRESTAPRCAFCASLSDGIQVIAQGESAICANCVAAFSFLIANKSSLATSDDSSTRYSSDRSPIQSRDSTTNAAPDVHRHNARTGVPALPADAAERMKYRFERPVLIHRHDTTDEPRSTTTQEDASRSTRTRPASTDALDRSPAAPDGTRIATTRPNQAELRQDKPIRVQALSKVRSLAMFGLVSVAVSLITSLAVLQWAPQELIGLQPIPGPQGPDGAQGPVGPVGPQGPSNYINTSSTSHNGFSVAGGFCAASGRAYRGGEIGGWTGTKKICEEACKSDVAHMCTSEELTRFAATGGLQPSMELWYASGLPLQGSPDFTNRTSPWINNCNGFTASYSSSYGTVWSWFRGEASSGAPTYRSCDRALRVACCK